MDRKLYGLTNFEIYRWQRYQPDMGSYDERDAPIQEVFELYHLICHTLNTAEVAIPRGGLQDRT